MNFDFSPDQKTLRDQARKFLREQASSTRVRRILEGDAPYDAELWRGMARDGLDRHRDSRERTAARASAISSCACSPRSWAGSLAPTPFSSTIYLAAEALLLAGSEAQKKRWLPRIAPGEAIGCFALAEGPQAPTAGNLAHPRRAAACSTGTKVPVPDGDVADFAVVAAARRARTCRPLPRRPARARASRARAARRRSTRPARTRASPSTAPPAEPLGAPGAGWPLARARCSTAPPCSSPSSRSAARQAALDMAREYALGRFAFGRPIASFQAIKHKLADMYVAVELARSNAYYGAWALSTDAPELPVAAAAARVSRQRGLLPRRQGEHPDPRRHGLHVGVRLPPPLPPRQAHSASCSGSARRWKDLLIRIEARARRAPAPPDGGLPWTSTTPGKKRRSAPRPAQFLGRQRRAQARHLRDVAEPLPGRDGSRASSAPRSSRRKKADAGFAALALARRSGAAARCRRSTR